MKRRSENVENQLSKSSFIFILLLFGSEFRRQHNGTNKIRSGQKMFEKWETLSGPTTPIIALICYVKLASMNKWPSKNQIDE